MKDEETSLTVGVKVRLAVQPPYFKTAEPMPMLRPPDIIKVGEEGTICDRRPGGYWAVKFSRGTFLIDAQYIEAIASSPEEK